VAGSCKCSNDLASAIKCWVFLDWLSNSDFSRRALVHGGCEAGRRAGGQAGRRAGIFTNAELLKHAQIT